MQYNHKLWFNHWMAVTYSTFDAKTKLSEILERVSEGEEIVITKHGRPVAKVTRVVEPGTRELGFARNEIILHPGWDTPITEEEFVGE